MKQIQLSDYRHLIRLDEPFVRPEPAPADEAGRTSYVNDLLTHLLEEHERNGGGKQELPDSYPAKRRMLRALLTTRGPDPLPISFHDQLDRLLTREVVDRGVVDVMDLAEFAPGQSLWRGDITTLKAGAVVNSANSGLLGCFTPFHMCIDNVIHNAAGPMVREDCHRIMEIQEGEESTGGAKITRAFNLPADYILHTVGPIWSDNTGENEVLERDLAACYRSCLDLASSVAGIESVVFCCVSTGEFGFPNGTAADVALETVQGWLNDNPGAFEKVVFNVFAEVDLREYAARTIRTVRTVKTKTVRTKD